MAAAVLHPDEIARIERLALGADRRVPGSAAGPHRSWARGRSLDVVDWREYQPGDDPRTIDVQAWARLDQVLVRLYEADVDLRVQLVVDTSASMGIGGKHRQAVRVAAALAVAALVRNETVSVCTLADPVPRRFRGRGALAAVLELAGSWHAEGPTPLVEQARRLGATTRRAGLVVVVSDFLTPEALDGIDRLAARREQVVAVQVTCAEDEDPDVLGEVQLVDVESGERVEVDLNPSVIAAFRIRRRAASRALSTRLARHGGLLLQVDAAEDLVAEVLPRLVARGMLR